MYISSAEEFERILGRIFFKDDSPTVASNNEYSILTHGYRQFSKRPMSEEENSEFMDPALSTPGLPFNSLKAGCQRPHG